MKTQNEKIEELGKRNAIAVGAQGTVKTEDTVRIKKSKTATKTAKAQAEQPAPAYTDTRLPIDSEVRKQNRSLPTQTVIQRLAEVPAVAACARVVGAWVWVQFKDQPAAEIRQQLAQLGFHWNRTRQAWQHPCGKFSTAARQSDPRDTYASTPAMEALN